MSCCVDRYVFAHITSNCLFQDCCCHSVQRGLAPRVFQHIFKRIAEEEDNAVRAQHCHSHMPTRSMSDISITSSALVLNECCASCCDMHCAKRRDTVICVFVVNLPISLDLSFCSLGAQVQSGMCTLSWCTDILHVSDHCPRHKPA